MEIQAKIFSKTRRGVEAQGGGGREGKSKWF